MMTLYLDMDGVLCDFDTKYAEIYPDLEDKRKFQIAVEEHEIFKNLKPMPDTLQLLLHVATLKHIHIEILTSVGTFDENVGHKVKLQKAYWLEKNNIPHKPNFVKSKAEKAEYANKKSILIDDRVGCVEPFIAAGGHAILHKNAKTTIVELTELIDKIKAEEARLI